MKKGLLFDFNGTMFFDSPKHKRAWDAFSKKYRGIPISDEEMDQLHGKTNKNIIEILLKEIDDKKSVQLSNDKEALYRDICRQEPASFHLVPGLTQLLDTLKEQRIPMTICSASIKENIDFFVESFHLDQWFPIEDIVYDDGLHENKIAMFQDGAKRIGVPIEDCMVIEDSLSGIEFARQCKVAQIIAITDPEKAEEYQKLPGVDKVIQDYYDFDLSFFQK